jgi:hypothetical protein
MIHLPTVVSAGVLGWVSKGELFGPHRCGPSRSASVSLAADPQASPSPPIHKRLPHRRSASVSLTYDPRSAGPPP